MNATFPIGLKLSTGQAVVATTVAPALFAIGVASGRLWLGIVLAVLTLGLGLVAVRGRTITGWVRALYSWQRRRTTAPAAPSEPVVGSTVMPGDHVAVRWHDQEMVALIELIPRPYTPSIVIDKHCFTDDFIDTALVEELLYAHCPDLQADVISAGYRVGKTAPAGVISLYEQMIGTLPAPAHRRTWIVLRAEPDKTRRSSQRRADGVGGLARYLVASATRVADQLASNGVDARCARSFDDFDSATAISFEDESWSSIKGRNVFTAAYSAPGGPDAWWSERADHTITRVTVKPGSPPTSTVLLTTLARPTTPRGFSRLFGGQRAALSGLSPLTDKHHKLPIGSAGVLIGETNDRNPVFLPFDDVDHRIIVGDGLMFSQFMVRSAAAGAVVTVDARLREFGDMVNARFGEPKLNWPGATTYFTPHHQVEVINLNRNYIITPRHGKLPIRLVEPREESRYADALKR
jgi:type VII secretion protein EccE